MKAQFITSLETYNPEAIPDLPEIAIAGRSNVGKSTLINRVTNRNGLARVSGTPGKTRLLNVFLLEDKINLIDLPGYGFAQASKAEKARWSERVESYFRKTRRLIRVLHLVDIRHEPTAEDLAMHAYLLRFKTPYATIATKSDKLSKAACHRAIMNLARALQVQPWEIVAFSGETGVGVTEVTQLLLGEQLK